MQIINKCTGEVLATVKVSGHSISLDEALSLTSLKVMQTEEDRENGDGVEYEDLDLVYGVDD